MKRTQYEKSFKVMIVELLENGHTGKKIKEEYGSNPNMVYRWRQEFKDKTCPSFTGNGNSRLTQEQEEIARLKKELKEITIERHILKRP